MRKALVRKIKLHFIDTVSMLSPSSAEVKLGLLRLRQHSTRRFFGEFSCSQDALREILLPRPNEVSIESEPRSQSFSGVKETRINRWACLVGERVHEIVDA